MTNKDWERLTYALVATLVLVMSVAFFMCANAVLDYLASKNSAIGDRATWFAAFGTFATLGMTIWLATSERRNRRRSERAFAVVSAASFEIELADCMTSVSNALEFLTDFNNGQDIGMALKGREILIDTTPIRTHDAAQLVVIDPKLAMALARAGSVLARIQKMLAKQSNPFLPELTGKVVDFASQEQACRDLLTTLEWCIEACRNAQTLRIE